MKRAETGLHGGLLPAGGRGSAGLSAAGCAGSTHASMDAVPCPVPAALALACPVAARPVALGPRVGVPALWLRPLQPGLRTR